MNNDYAIIFKTKCAWMKDYNGKHCRIIKCYNLSGDETMFIIKFENGEIYHTHDYELTLGDII